MVYVMEKKSFIIGIILLLVIMLGSTYAFYKWNSSDNMDVDVKIEGATVTFNGGDDITGTLIPVSKKEEGIKKDIKVQASAEGATFNLYMSLTTMTDRLKEESFKYEVYYNDSSLVKSGNFGEYNSSTNPNGISYATTGVTKITLVNGMDISTSSTDKYTVYLWFDGENYGNPDTMQNNKVSFDLTASGENATLAG